MTSCHEFRTAYVSAQSCELTLLSELGLKMNHRARPSTRDPAIGTLTYLYDPLCGWCYGATPALEALQARTTITFLATGMFAGEGARTMDAGFAAYAWDNDRRIEALTGQPFSHVYRERILQPGIAFDSTAAALALAAVGLDAPQRVFDAYKAIQHARYVDGRDTSVREEVAAVLDSAGLSAPAKRMRAADPEVLAYAQRQIAHGRRLMAAHGARGVPTLILTAGEEHRILPSQVLYGDRETLLRHVNIA
ncbi:conserved hypothetical protein [Chelatococcus asaccharovorans]|nr:conserved hypothetical protein [Chelatococcus asaccharovorans]CAH1692383.1 conserved hypothetical protein [Chelatococcus asaccharovorans]